MLKDILILLLSIFLLFSCSTKNNVNKTGCKKYDFYCKRTGVSFKSSNDKSLPEPTDLEIAISIYYEAIESLQIGDAFYAAKKFREVENLLPQDKWASKASLMASYAEYSRSSYSSAIFSLERHVKYYPADKNIAYAHYLMAMCYYEQILDEKKRFKAVITSKRKI